jgi:hypothetical protein
MKRIHSQNQQENTPYRIMNKHWSRAVFLLRAGVMSGLTLLSINQRSWAEEAAPSKTSTEAKEEKEYSNSVQPAISGVLIDGSEAEFMRRHGIDRTISGGIEDFHYERNLSKESTMSIDGRGIFDSHDYFLKLEVDREKFGKWELGYKEFRTWYDGSGGFYPQGGGQWFRLYDPELKLDRGEAWFKAELAIPDLPVLEFEYMYEFRNGQKDSLHWGDTTFGGLGTHKIVPSFRDINERRDIFDVNLKHDIDITSYKVGLTYETTADANKLYVRRNPGQSIDRSITTREIQQGDSFNFYGSTETWFSENLLLSTGYSLRTLDTDIGGDFIYGTGYDAPFDARFPGRQTNDSGFLDLEGGSQKKQAIVNINGMLIPSEKWTVISGVRIEADDTDGFAHHLISSSSGVTTRTYVDGRNDVDLIKVSENAELRYTGFTNWVFFVRGGWDENQINVSESLRNPDTSVYTFRRETETDRLGQKYTAGANWYPMKKLNLGGQYYHRINSVSYNHLDDTTLATGGDRYPAFIDKQEFETDDLNLRVKWRVLSNLTSVSRYDFQETSIVSTMSGLASQESGRTTSHIWGETLSWNPLSRLYLQGGINYALNRTETPLNGYFGAVQEAKNNYLVSTFSSGYGIDDKTDIYLQYNYYHAFDNYYDNSEFGLPLGSAAEENQVILKLDRRISDTIHWTGQYGFFSNSDKLYGGNKDYDAHMLYSSINIVF